MLKFPQLLRVARPATHCLQPKRHRYALPRYHLCPLVASCQRLFLCHWSGFLWPHPHSLQIPEVPPFDESPDLDVLEDPYTWYVDCLRAPYVGAIRLTWGFPSTAEWALARLRAEADHQLETLRNQDTSSANEEGESTKDPVRVGRYHCMVGDRHGKLSLSTDGVSFKKYMFSNDSWSVCYEDMRSMQKVLLYIYMLSAPLVPPYCDLTPFFNTL